MRNALKALGTLLVWLILAHGVLSGLSIFGLGLETLEQQKRVAEMTDVNGAFVVPDVMLFLVQYPNGDQTIITCDAPTASNCR